MWWTFVALAMTVFMGGIIAYNGDLIGRKYGKRRVKVFGLRPKHSAILITSVTGILISAITTGVLFLLVRPVREVILEGEAAIRAQRDFKRQREEAENQLHAEQAKLMAAIGENKLLETKRDLAEKQLKQEQAKVTAAQAKTTDAENAAAGARKELVSVRGQLASQRQQLTTAREQYTEAKEQFVLLGTKNTELRTRNGQLLTANGALLADNQRLTQENRQKIAENADYSKQNGELARQNEFLVRENDSLAKQRTDLTNQRVRILENIQKLTTYSGDLETKNKELTAANSRLTNENVQLTEQLQQIAPGYNSLRDAYSASRTKRIVVHRDEDLARLVIPAVSSPEKVRELLQQLLSNAGREATSRGAGVGEQARAVQMVDRRYLTRGPSGQGAVDVTGEDRLDAMVSRLSYQTTPSCVLAVAVTNSVEGEPAIVDLAPITNRPIYTKGQVVAMRRINAGQPTEKLFENMVVFLKEMGQGALQEGVIPRMDASGEPQVGSLNAANIAELVQHIREHTGYVRVRAVAADNISSADPLNVTIQIEP